MAVVNRKEVGFLREKRGKFVGKKVGWHDKKREGRSIVRTVTAGRSKRWG